MKNSIAGIILFLLSLFTVAPALSLASADVIFNGGGGSDVGLGADTGDNGSQGSGYDDFAGDVFTAPENAQINSIQFYGFNFLIHVSSTDSFTVDFFAVGSSGAPSQTLLGTSLISGVTKVSDPSTSYKYTGSFVDPFVVAAGTSYYVGIGDTTTPYAAFSLDDVSISEPQGSSIAYLYDSTHGGFLPVFTDSFSLELFGAAVPEPSPEILAFIGLGLLIFLHTHFVNVRRLSP